MKSIVVEFSGWCVISPEKVNFVCIGSDKPDITGVEWLALDEDAQSDYVIEDIIAIQRDCDDGDYSMIEVFEDA